MAISDNTYIFKKYFMRVLITKANYNLTVYNKHIKVNDLLSIDKQKPSFYRLFHLSHNTFLNIMRKYDDYFPNYIAEEK